MKSPRRACGCGCGQTAGGMHKRRYVPTWRNAGGRIGQNTVWERVCEWDAYSPPLAWGTMRVVYTLDIEIEVALYSILVHGCTINGFFFVDLLSLCPIGT